MAQINPKLNLNKTPAVVDNNSLIFAKNIRLDVDKSIHRDYGTFPMSIVKSGDDYINHENIIKRIVSDIKENEEEKDYYNQLLNKLNILAGNVTVLPNGKIENATCKIVGIIPNSNEFYLFIYGTYQINSSSLIRDYEVSLIIRYNEKQDKFEYCNCNWTYHKGTINGCVINNLRGEKILNIGENNATEFVPLKCINLNKSSYLDDESIYTQTPNIPITNLDYLSNINYSIPNGVYQFFVRYKIREDFYTDWFPASKELFAGNNVNLVTGFGSINYVNTHRDSDHSFKFAVSNLYNEHSDNYKSFQIGFILSHDNEIVARAWKHFPLNVGTINFDYDSKDAEEIEVTDLTKTTYQLYDVGNIVNFKNKLYISNYKETDFNDIDLQNIANEVNIDVYQEESPEGYAGYTPETDKVNGLDVIYGLTDKETNETIHINGEDGIINKLLTNHFGYNSSIKDVLDIALCNENHSDIYFGSEEYGMKAIGEGQTFSAAKNALQETYNGSNYKDATFSFGETINKITVNGVSVKLDVDSIISNIYNTNRYLNENCNFINASGFDASQITIILYRSASIKYRKWVSGGLTEYNPDKPGQFQNTGGYYKDYEENPQYEQKFTINLYGDKSKYVKNDASNFKDYTTLIPYQSYKFYIHFVKQNGEITNGYYCGGDKAGVINVGYSKTASYVNYPKFSNIKKPEGYVACFFSILHYENKVGTLFNIKGYPKESPNIYEGSCLDLNIGTLHGGGKLNIRQSKKKSIIPNPNLPKPFDPSFPDIRATTESFDDIETNTGVYHYSSDSSNVRYFGADGIITFDKVDNFDINSLAYVVNEYNVSESNDSMLIKCTPYIKLESNTTEFGNFTNMNLLGYICVIYPLNRDVITEYFTDGNSVYVKDSTTTVTDNDIYYNLTELKVYLGDTKDDSQKITMMNLRKTDPVSIYSNYNLNYISLTQEPTERPITYYSGSADGPSESRTTYSMILRLFPSLILSNIYELQSMYKEYPRKLYSKYTDNNITEFNNTIRSSILEGDEAFINIFKFDAEDYYNVPTNRGIIVNLLSVGDSILVHCEDSMFRFSGTNSLQSNNGDVQTTETNVFDTGVVEVFGSDFGFAGLQNKTDSIVTENGYIFFDRDSRIVYMYSGQGQIIKLSDSIEKLFRYKDISNIYFANDYYNNRFFMSIIFYDNDSIIPVTLSFNFIEEVKSFVSLHDFYFLNAFNTKTKCYFLTNDNKDICTINKEHLGCYTKLELTDDKLYLAKKENKTIKIKNGQNYNVSCYDSIIDVICNTNFETVKTLNSIKWYSKIVLDEFNKIDYDDAKTLKMLESYDTNYPCKYLRVYTDTCMTRLNTFDYPSNDYSITSADSYMKPRYNQGYWSFNYFRNIQNANGNIDPYVSDQNSLIEGLYFVARFGFDEEFKFETISFNYSDKL